MEFPSKYFDLGYRQSKLALFNLNCIELSALGVMHEGMNVPPDEDTACFHQSSKHFEKVVHVLDRLK